MRFGGGPLEIVVPDALEEVPLLALEAIRPAAIALIGDVTHIVDSTGYVIGPADTGACGKLPALVGLEGLEDEALVSWPPYPRFQPRR